MMLYNPLGHDINRVIDVCVYYTGIEGVVRLIDADGREQSLPIGSRDRLRLEVTIPANGFTHFVMKQGE